MSNLSSQLGASSTASAQETALTVAPPPSAQLASYSQPTQQLLIPFPIHQNCATVFETIEDALKSIIPNIIKKTSTDAKVNPSSKVKGTPAYCIDQLLNVHNNWKLSQEQRIGFLANKIYTAKDVTHLHKKYILHNPNDCPLHY